MTNYEERAKGIILSFFVANKGKWVTASEISNHIQENNFHLGRYGQSLTPKKISKLLKSRAFSDIESELYQGYIRKYRL